MSSTAYIFTKKGQDRLQTSNRLKPKVHYFRVFGSKCFILNKKSKSSMFAPKVDEGFMVMVLTNMDIVFLIKPPV